MIFLHIGRGKAGSTTIQDFLAANRDKLQAEGFRIPDIQIGPWIKSIDRGQSGIGEETKNIAMRLAQELKAEPEARFLISNEYFMRLTTDEKLSAVQAVFNGHEIRLLAYLRDYPSLIVSLYNQATKKGKNIANFDRYFDRKKEEIRARAPLAAWAKSFGWERLRIRSLDPRSLTGGDLVQDYSAAVGIDGIAGFERGAVSEANKSESWLAVEMIRSVLARMDLGPKEGQKRRKVIARIQKAVRKIVEREPSLLSRAQYLTQEQWRFLNNLYNEDVAFLTQNCPGAVLPPQDSMPPGERAFLPSEEYFPDRIKAILEKIVRQDVSLENMDLS